MKFACWSDRSTCLPYLLGIFFFHFNLKFSDEMDHADWFVSLDKPIEFQHCNNIIGRGECICSGMIISLQCLPCNKSAFSWHFFVTNIKETTVHYPRLLPLFTGFQKNCVWSPFWPWLVYLKLILKLLLSRVLLSRLAYYGSVSLACSLYTATMSAWIQFYWFKIQ